MKYEIEIEGLPEGWEPIAIRKQKLGEHIFCLDTGFVVPADHRTPKAHLIVKKKQPRRIVLEETGEKNHLYESGQYSSFSAGGFVISGVRNKWREVKENDLSLNNEEPKLSLTVDECRSMSLSGISMKIADFLKDK